MIKLIKLLFILPVYIVSLYATTPQKIAFINYTVQKGDMLSSIAHYHNTTVSELKKINGLKSNTLKVGQRLKIPVKIKEVVVPNKKKKISKKDKTHTTKKVIKKYHIVKSGETIRGIAHKYHISVKKLRELNGLKKDNYIIQVGMKLVVAEEKKVIKSSITPSKKSETVKKEYVYHIVKRRDTLKKIAKKYGVSVAQIKRLNNFKKRVRLKKGMRIKVAIKQPKKSETVKKEYVYHIVKRRDTLKKIAKKYGVSVAQIKKLNNFKKRVKLKKGMKIKVALKEPKKSKTTHSDTNNLVAKADTITSNKNSKILKLLKGDKYYTVGSGDTLFSIAIKHKVSLKELMRLNHIGVTDIIKKGQKLRIPLTDYEKKLVADYKKKEAERKRLARLYKIETHITKHTVKSGESLWKIAKKYGVSIADIKRLNNLGKKVVIHKGMVLVIKKETVMIPRKIKKVYIVKRGDTLWKIAKRNGVKIADIKKWNKLDKKLVLKKGMKLTLYIPNKELLKTDRLKKKSRVRVAKAKKSKHTRIASKRHHRRDPMSIFNGNNHNNAEVIRIAKRYLGRRYVWGAEGPNSFDCSGFTQYVMRKSKGIKIPRVSRRQAYYGKYVSRRNLKPGDLIFFDTSRRRRGYVNHVGIYIGNNKFIHASSARHRVVITSLERPFYKARFKWGRRIN